MNGLGQGSSLASELWGEVRGLIPETKRREVARKIIKAFENYDCDTIGEAEDLVRDAGLEKRYYGE